MALKILNEGLSDTSDLARCQKIIIVKTKNKKRKKEEDECPRPPTLVRAIVTFFLERRPFRKLSLISSNRKTTHV